MPNEALETDIRGPIAAETRDGLRAVPYIWQGGDAPVLGLEFFERAGSESNILATAHRADSGKRPRPTASCAGAAWRFCGSYRSAYGAPRTDDDLSDLVTQWNVAPKTHGETRPNMFDQSARHDIGRMIVQVFETQEGLWSEHPTSRHILAETCGTALALEHNGDLYTCDHFVYPEFRPGNIMTGDIGAQAGATLRCPSTPPSATR